MKKSSVAMAIVSFAIFFPGIVAAKTTTVTAKEFKFVPDEITVRKGEPVSIILKDKGVLSHNLHIPALGVTPETIQSGDQEPIKFTPEKTGTFEFFCAVPGHKQAGMKGTLKVVK